MNINSLPELSFCKLLNFMPIDERLKIFPIFAPFQKESFKRIDTSLSVSKSLGIDTLVFDSEQRQLLDRYLNDQDNIYQRWHCSCLDHSPVHLFSSNLCMQSKCTCCQKTLLICILKRCPQIESIDLRGLHLTEELLRDIIEFCPNLNCLKLNFVSFDQKSFDIFTESICAKILHISFDNIFFTSSQLTSMIENLKNVEELEILKFNNSNLPVDAFKKLSPTLAYFSILFYRSNSKQLGLEDSSNVALCMQQMADGLAKNIEYLKIISNYNQQINYELTYELRRFTKLKSINLSYMHLVQENNFKTTYWWPKLECLTIDLYYLSNAFRVLMTFLQGNYNSNLKRLQLMSCKLHKHAMALQYFCPNLVQLTLLDVLFKPDKFDAIFQNLGKLKKLRKLYIEYSLFRVDEKLPESSMREQCQYHAFPSNQMSVLEDFVSTHSSLTEISLIDWPGLTHGQLDRLFTIAREKQIMFHFQQAPTNFDLTI